PRRDALLLGDGLSVMDEMTPAQTAAMMHGLATNPAVAVEDRLDSALQALEFYTGEERLAEIAVAIGKRIVTQHADVLSRLAEGDSAPQGWKDLISGLMLMSK